MLRQLADYAGRKDLAAESGFAPKQARWTLMLATDGRYLGVVELGDTEAKRNPGRTFPRAPEFSFSDMKAGGVTKSHFLIDTADVVALLGADDDDAKVRAKHDYFIELLREAAEVMPQLRAGAEALASADILAAVREDLAAQKAKPTDKVTLQIGDAFPADSDAWHDWWRAKRASIAGDKAPGALMRCLVTGDVVEPATTHPKIRGLAGVGGSSMGSPLVGFDKDAFESYGLRQSANAAVSEETAAAYRAALNDLLAHHSHKIAAAMVTYWYREDVRVENDPVAILLELREEADPDSTEQERKELQAQQRAAAFLRSVQEGKRAELRGNTYYALTLSGAGGRVMVRDWMEGAFEDLADCIIAWFDDLAIVHRSGQGEAPWPKFLAVVAATARELRDVPAPLVARLWRVAIRNEPIPGEIMAQALSRVRVDIIQGSTANHARMGLLRAYHVRKHRQRGDKQMADQFTPYLNEDHPEPAYQCGRLMAVLAALQRAALGDVGAGVIQRYYAAACTTPGLVLGRLIKLSQFHLNKLQPGLAWWYEDRLGRIWGRIKDTVPSTLSLEEQSLFALGYYQQLADLRTKKVDEPEPEVAQASEDQSLPLDTPQ